MPLLLPVPEGVPAFEPVAVPAPEPVWDVVSWPAFPLSPAGVSAVLPGLVLSGVRMMTVCSTVFGMAVPWASLTGTKLKLPSLLEAFQKIRSKSAREMTWPTVISCPFSRVIRPLTVPAFLPRMEVMRMNSGVSWLPAPLKMAAPMALFSSVP